MSGVFRFSNAVSDVDKLIQTFKTLTGKFGELTGNDTFGHNEAARFLAEQGLASSLGAIGNEAITRSFNAKTAALNPLYNQHKSYSEFFRMIGWYIPTEKKSEFQISELGKIICYDGLPPAELKKLVEQCILHIASPNHLTEVKGGNILRPFPLLLKLLNRLDGFILRDEIIVAVLACSNDRVAGIVDTQEQLIRDIRRAGFNELESAVMNVRTENGVNHFKSIDGVKTSVSAPLGKDTLPNYTRLPIALCKWLGWAEEINIKGIYGNKKVHALKITEYGKELASKLETIKDIRYEDIADFDEKAIVAFSAYSNLAHLQVAFNCFEDYSDILPIIIRDASPVFDKFDIKPMNEDFLFFGYQECPISISDREKAFS